MASPSMMLIRRLSTSRSAQAMVKTPIQSRLQEAEQTQGKGGENIRMVGSKNLENYRQVKDKYGEKVSSWAVQVQPGLAKCTICPNTTINFSKGKLQLTHHSESNKHRKCAPGKQQSIGEAFGAVRDNCDKELVYKARDLEIAITQLLSRHSIPVGVVECLTAILKKHVTDSEIVKKIKLGRTKANYYTEHGLAAMYEEKTVQKLKNCDAFGVAFDESEVNKKSEMEVIVNIADPNSGLESRHYKVIDLEAGDAETITNALLDEFTEDGVDFKQKMITADVDGCNTMQGHKTGVMTRLKEQIPQLESLGSSNAHNISNAMMHGVTECEPDMKEALVDLYQDIGGAKGKGLKKQKECKAVAKALGIKFKPIKRFVSTRFRSLRTCIEPVLHNYLALVAYYKGLKKPTPRQKRLQAYFVDRCDMTRIKLKFVFAATADLSRGIDFFEQRKVHVHFAKEKMEALLLSQLKKCIKEELLTNLDQENNEVTKKTSRELFNIEVTDKTLLENHALFIGKEVEKEIKALGLRPSSPQLHWLFSMVKAFHKTVSKYLIKYFSTGLKSSIMDNMSGLSPSYHSHVLTSRKIKALANQFSKVVDNIELVEGLDQLKTEVDRYVTDDDIKEMEEMDFEEFWTNVGKLTDGGAEWTRYVILPRFALAMGVKYNDTSDVERSFSLMNYVHQNKQRNCMNQSMLDAHMHIRSGVESKETRAKCVKCKEQDPVDQHCHCDVTVITDELREKCQHAWQSYSATQKAAAVEAEGALSEMEEKKQKTEAVESERLKDFARRLGTKDCFYGSIKMKSVYSVKRRVVGREGERKEVQGEGPGRAAGSGKGMTSAWGKRASSTECVKSKMSRK